MHTHLHWWGKTTKKWGHFIYEMNITWFYCGIFYLFYSLCESAVSLSVNREFPSGTNIVTNQYQCIVGGVDSRTFSRSLTWTSEKWYEKAVPIRKPAWGCRHREEQQYNSEDKRCLWWPDVTSYRLWANKFQMHISYWEAISRKQKGQTADL